MKAFILTPVVKGFPDRGDMDLYSDLDEAIRNCRILNNPKFMMKTQFCVWEADVSIALQGVVYSTDEES